MKERLFALVGVFFLIACGKPHFEQASVTMPSEEPEEVEAPAVVVEQKPRISFFAPLCQPRSICTAEFRLEKAAAKVFEFDWHTNDTLYLTPPPPGQPVFGEPNVHYVPNQGHIVFQPGETVKKLQVQNISPFNYEIMIGLRMQNCKSGGLLENCTAFFK